MPVRPTNFPRRVYTRLKAHGHCPMKAVEIILDAKRKDQHALKWIKLLRSLAP